LLTTAAELNNPSFRFFCEEAVISAVSVDSAWCGRARDETEVLSVSVPVTNGLPSLLLPSWVSLRDCLPYHMPAVLVRE